MNLEPTEIEAHLRAEVRAWLREHLPWEYGRGLPPHFDDLAEEVAFGRDWQAKLAGARAPELVGRIGVNLVGPTLLAHGAPEQKARWLPNILSARELWCQLFSEPGAGSDLASVLTRAEAAEGGWILNGQKVWTSYAQFADWGVCLARTDPEAPKSKGISFFVVDMRDPGVEVRPLRQITDESEFNEVFF